MYTSMPEGRIVPAFIFSTIPALIAARISSAVLTGARTDSKAFQAYPYERRVFGEQFFKWRRSCKSVS
jgi:hypothetical protein